ncbi:MAG TPA: DinB family protein [Ktedonobacteraceae bacterium]|nr:DinB family protein [Ktedonobacteraceae bacterium]
MATEQALSLITFYAGWAGFQSNLVKVIAPLTPEQLALRAAPHHWSIGMVAQHIIANRVWWFQNWLGQGSPELAPLANWEPMEREELPTHDAAELVAALNSTWQMIEDALSHWTPADLEYVVPQPAALEEEWRQIFVDLTRQWIIWHVLEHEILHGGELSLALGTYGLKAIYD